jgi:hypothetical protein
MPIKEVSDMGSSMHNDEAHYEDCLIVKRKSRKFKQTNKVSQIGEKIKRAGISLLGKKEKIVPTKTMHALNVVIDVF